MKDLDQIQKKKGDTYKCYSTYHLGCLMLRTGSKTLSYLPPVPLQCLAKTGDTRRYRRGQLSTDSKHTSAVPKGHFSL